MRRKFFKGGVWRVKLILIWDKNQMMFSFGIFFGRKEVCASLKQKRGAKSNHWILPLFFVFKKWLNVIFSK